MNHKQSIGPTLLFSLLAAAGVLVTGSLLLSRTSRSGPTEAAPAEPASTVSTPAAFGATGTRAPAAEAVPGADDVRPEVGLLAGLPGVEMTRAPDSPLNDLRLSFKLEPRLTRSLYMGDRWLAPSSYMQVGEGSECILEASLRGLNTLGAAVNTPATWRAADPDMVSISEPGPGNTVKLTVLRPGETTVEIAAQGITKRLPLHARSYGDTLMVAMAQ